MRDGRVAKESHAVHHLKNDKKNNKGAGCPKTICLMTKDRPTL